MALTIAQLPCVLATNTLIHPRSDADPGGNVRFGILGPMRISTQSREVPIKGELERSLLALLLLHPNQTLPADHLIEALWDGATPRSARGQLHSCVSRLRKRLTVESWTTDVITTDPDGYRIRVEPDAVDLLEFRRSAARAREAAQQDRPGAARDRYRAGLSLWRGPTLAGLRNAAIRRAAAAIDEEHAQVLAECIETELALGGAGELVSELTDLVQRHPFQEKLHAALMLALYRADRLAEALAAYQRVRRLLVSELGQEPGPALRELHHRILTSDHTLRLRRPTDGESEPAAPVRGGYLPRVVDDFIGRESDLGWLLKAAAEVDGYASPVLAIDGMPGVGKTTLAVRAAHQLTSEFPDGQLFVDLHGHSDHPPLDPATAINTLLGQLGVPPGQIPTNLDERIGRWRSELAGRRVLLVLDNAANGVQVTPLLPAGGGCMTLVTSRRRLTDLDGARPRSVQTLDPDEAITLLERIAGPRVRAEAAEAAEVAKRCGYLPLALRLAATRLAHRPQWQVRDLATRLADPMAPLTDLAGGDRTLIDAFGLSYAQLTGEAQRMLRLVGLHPANRFDTHTSAALADASLEQARRILDELVDAHLVEEPQPGRYRLHDLVRSFVSALAASTDPEPDRRMAVRRLLDYYLHAAFAASASVDSQTNLHYLRRDLTLDAPTRPDLLEWPYRQGANWFEAERPTLLAATRCAAAQSQWRHAWQLARVMWRFLARRGYLADIIDSHRHGLAAAEQLGDPDAVATMRNCLAFACTQMGDHDEAIGHLLAALRHRQATGDQTGEMGTRRNLVSAYGEAGRYREAVEEGERVLALLRTSDDTGGGLATALVNVGYAYLTIGQLGKALGHSRRGLLLAREIGDRQLIAIAIGNLGAIRGRMGDLRPAARLLWAAWRAGRRTKDRSVEAEALNELAMIDRALGDYDSAIARHQEALRLMREVGVRQGEYIVCRELGRTLYAAGDSTAALELHRRALKGNLRIRHRAGEARALDGIASCLRDTDPECARRHWLRALALFRELDLPERHEVERQLTALAGSYR